MPETSRRVGRPTMGKNKVGFFDSDSPSTRSRPRWHSNRSRTPLVMSFGNKPAYSANALPTISSLSILPTFVKPCKHLCQDPDHKSTPRLLIAASNRANIATKNQQQYQTVSNTPSTERTLDLTIGKLEPDVSMATGKVVPRHTNKTKTSHTTPRPSNNKKITV